MERKKLTVRINLVTYERLKLLSKQEKVFFQDLIDEILELGMLVKMKGGRK